jgi:hypothetical protein
MSVWWSMPTPLLPSVPATALPSLVVIVAVTGPALPPVRVTLTGGVGFDSAMV